MRKRGQLKRTPPTSESMRTKKFLDVLQAQTRRQPDKTDFIYLEHGEDEAERLTFAELHEKPHGVASQLRTSARSGDRVLLLYPTGLNFVAAFLGCLCAGVLAVPASPRGEELCCINLKLIYRHTSCSRFIPATPQQLVAQKVNTTEPYLCAVFLSPPCNSNLKIFERRVRRAIITTNQLSKENM